MKSILILAFVCVAFSASAETVKVYSRVGGVSVNQLCQLNSGDFRTTVSTCLDYAVNEAGPQCTQPTQETLIVSQYQTVCDFRSTGEDYPACVSSHVERVNRTSEVTVFEQGSDYTVNEAGPTQSSRVVGREIYTIPACVK